MNRITHWFVAAATCLLAVCTSVASAATTEVGGVKFESPIELAGTKLQLNGAGVRHKAVFQVYAAGLYLTQKANTPEEALAAPGPKRISITMLRSIDSAELGKLFTRGVEDNAPRGNVQADPRPDAHEPDLLGPENPGQRRRLHHRLDTGHRHRHLRQRQTPGGAVQGAGIFQRPDAHLAGAEPSGMETQGIPAGQIT